MKKTAFIIAAILAALTAAAALAVPHILPPVPEAEAVSTASAAGQEKNTLPSEEVLSSSSRSLESSQPEEPLDLFRNSAPEIPADTYLNEEEVAVVTGQQVLKRSPFLIGEDRIYAPKYVYRATDYSKAGDTPDESASVIDSSSTIAVNGSESVANGSISAVNDPESAAGSSGGAEVIDANTQVDLGRWNRDIQALYSYAPDFSDQVPLFSPGSAGCSSLTEDGGTLYFYGNVRSDDGSESPAGIYRVPSDGSSPAELLIEGKNIYPLLVQAGWLFYRNGNELGAYSDAEDISCCQVPEEKGTVRYMAAFNGYLLYLSMGEDTDGIEGKTSAGSVEKDSIGSANKDSIGSANKASIDSSKKDSACSEEKNSAHPHAGLAAIGDDPGLYPTFEFDLHTNGKGNVPTGFTFDGKILHYFDPIRGIMNRVPDGEYNRLSQTGVGPCFIVNRMLAYSGRDGIYCMPPEGGDEIQVIAAEKPFIQAAGMGKILYFEGIKSTRYHLLDLGRDQILEQDITAYIAP